MEKKDILLLETTLSDWQNWETCGKYVSAVNVSGNMFPGFVRVSYSSFAYDLIFFVCAFFQLLKIKH